VGRPTPVTRTDELIAAVYDELAGLRSDLAAQRSGAPPAPVEDGQIELLEPSAPAVRREQIRRRGKTQT
jgi:hypothetical protein